MSAGERAGRACGRRQVQYNCSRQVPALHLCALLTHACFAAGRHLNGLGLGGGITPDGWMELPRLEFVSLVRTTMGATALAAALHLSCWTPVCISSAACILWPQPWLRDTGCLPPALAARRPSPSARARKADNAIGSTIPSAWVLPDRLQQLDLVGGGDHDVHFAP